MKNTEIMISSENAEKVSDGTFPCHSRGFSTHIINPLLPNVPF